MLSDQRVKGRAVPPAPLPRFRLNVLGEFELLSSSGSAVRLPTRKAEALLAYLALAPRGAHGREALSDLLWGGTSARSARASLRQTLSLIGKALGPGVIEARGGAIALAAGALEVDAAEFEQCLGSDDPRDLARAAALYRGVPLAFQFAAESGFEEWALVTRERFRERAIDALLRLISLYSASGEAEQGIDAALRLLAIDPLEEAAHRALMRLYAAQGRRAASLRQYQQCVGILRRELGTDPGAETRALYHDLIRNDLPGDAGEPTHAPASDIPSPDTPLIGRDPELSAAAAAVRELTRGQGGVLAILGEAGIGKTRLAEEMARIAGREGVRILVGRCYESEQNFPFAPWASLLRAAGVPEDADLLARLDAPWRRELGQLLPELAEDRAAPADDHQLASRRSRMFDAIVHVVAAIAARGPVLLVLEDLHWADEMSLRLLAASGRRVKGQPVSIVLTARDEEMPGQPVLRPMLAELDRAGVLTPLRLPSLTREDTFLLVRAMARKGSDDAATRRLAERIWQASEGNPFVVVESMRAAGTASAADGATPLPERVRQMIEDHLDRLGAGARELLATIAVAGRACEFALLRDASGLAERAASDALEELVRRQVLHVVGENFDFVHDRIRRVADGKLLPPARQQRHAAIARTLEVLHATDLAPVYDRLAYHFSRTDQAAKAVTYLTRFAERAARTGAHERAIAALDEAAARLAQGEAAGRERYDLVFRKTRSLLLLGRLKEVVEALIPQQGFIDDAADPSLAGAYHLRLGAAYNYLGDRRQSTHHGTRALEAAATCGDTATMAKAHVLLANDRFWGEPEVGLRHAEAAIALLEKLDLPWWMGQAHWILGLNLSYRGRFDEALAAEVRATELGALVGDRRLVCTAAWATGFVSTLAGDWATAVAACRKGVEAAPDPLSRMTAAGMLALALVESRTPDEAIRILDEAIPVAERFRFGPLHGLYLGFRGEAALQKGDLEGAAQYAEQGAGITKRSGYFYGLGWTQRILGRIARARGDFPAARQHLEQATETFQDMGAPFEAARTRLELGEWLHAAGEPAQARRLGEEAKSALDALGLQPFAARARRLLEAVADTSATPPVGH